jgi:LmbE family N-acetylglucosaminyl deacetylase
MLLSRLAAGERIVEPVVLLVAHPDDEIIGAGSRLHLCENLTLVHVTDGAPRDLQDARAHGFYTAQAYAAARRRELDRALEAAGARPVHRVSLDVPDQEASLNLTHIANRLTRVFAEAHPELVITHPYEGGHPDHDACAFAVHRAAGRTGVEVAEFACYNGHLGCFAANEFIGQPDAFSVVLTPPEQQRKRRALDCFDTQRHTLAQFGLWCERFRPAPRYDFARPPHPGRLYYEHFDWGMTGHAFRMLARSAADVLTYGAAA